MLPEPAAPASSAAFRRAALSVFSLRTDIKVRRLDTSVESTCGSRRVSAMFLI